MQLFCDLDSLFFTCVCVCVVIVKGSAPDSMPSWMFNLCKKFTSSCSFNIRLFVAKLILNTEEVSVVPGSRSSGGVGVTG